MTQECVDAGRCNPDTVDAQHMFRSWDRPQTVAGPPPADRTVFHGVRSSIFPAPCCPMTFRPTASMQTRELCRGPARPRHQCRCRPSPRRRRHLWRYPTQCRLRYPCFASATPASAYGGKQPGSRYVPSEHAATRTQSSGLATMGRADRGRRTARCVSTEATMYGSGCRGQLLSL